MLAALESYSLVKGLGASIYRSLRSTSVVISIVDVYLMAHSAMFGSKSSAKKLVTAELIHILLALDGTTKTLGHSHMCCRFFTAGFSRIRTQVVDEE